MAGKAGNALISVYDKAGIEDFASGLHKLGWKIFASGGTYRAITKAGVPASDVADLVGGEAILGHKVVTLSREISAGLLANLSDPKEMSEMRRSGHPIIHLVCQDSYPLEEEIADPDSTDASVLAQSDIGGPTMLREAAKGRRIVLSVPKQREQVLKWLRAGRPDEKEFIDQLAARAVYEVARYSAIEAGYWNGDEVSLFVGRKVADTKYGENPQQEKAAFYADNRVSVDPLGLDQFEHRKGWELSFINETDIDRLVQTSTHIAAGFERNFGAVPEVAIAVKHGNACGVGVAENLADAIKKAIDGDTRAIFGGVVMVNGKIDKTAAETLTRYQVAQKDADRLLDGVIGSDVTKEALEVLKRAKLRVVTNPALADLNEASLDSTRRKRPVRGGMLEQDNYTFVQDLSAEFVEQYGVVSEQQKRDLILAWAIGSTSNSNTITLVKNGMLIGNGVGQQDRVGAGQLALSRTTTELPTLEKTGISAKDELIMRLALSRSKLEGAVAYSDSFFPFPDGPTLLVEAGIKAILTSWNTEAHKEILKKVHEAGASIVMIPDKFGRGFFAH